MKDQYFGDVNDYRKYGLLRSIIEGSELSLGVCWLRTANDGRGDGELRRYLHEEVRWRHYDPELYEALKRLLEPGVERSVLHAESWGLLRGARYHHAILSDEARARHLYFDEAWQRLRDAQLMFLDPDNGLEVQSVGFGRKNSGKYLYWREVVEAYRRGHSLVIYQHFRRKKREMFVKDMEDELRQRLDGTHIESFRTAHVVFLVAIRPEHSERVFGNI